MGDAIYLTETILMSIIALSVLAGVVIGVTVVLGFIELMEGYANGEEDQP